VDREPLVLPQRGHDLGLGAGENGEGGLFHLRRL
jgi:hypothetical protein